MYPILSAEFIAPDVKLFRIEAPYIARKHQAGQFVILRVHENGERNPITISDSNLYIGDISIIVQGIISTTKKFNRIGIYRNQEKKAHEK
ncbi:unnamed protein product [marine sediment metagenome]|uniref:Uncharacterized protein n=1 Tax=marine sediment metagenome TaxID=412755 RepID=X1FLL5_9ZZZZ